MALSKSAPAEGRRTNRDTISGHRSPRASFSAAARSGRTRSASRPPGLNEETLLLFADGQAQHIHTDRSHPAPENLWPTALGDLVGNWEDNTFAIDTVQRKAGPMVRVPHFLSPDQSAQAHFVERLKMVSADPMVDQMTIDDPARFEHPWVVTLRFRRVKNVDRLIATDCSENDRFRVINNKETLR